MDPNEYQKQAERTETSQLAAARRIVDLQDEFGMGAGDNVVRNIRLLHSVIGLMGELGELAYALEKHFWYGQELNVGNFKEELGDAEWYIAEACNALRCNLANILAGNISKLKVRFPEKYSDHQAAEENRDRQAEAKAINTNSDLILDSEADDLVHRMKLLMQKTGRDFEELVKLQDTTRRVESEMAELDTRDDRNPYAVAEMRRARAEDDGVVYDREEITRAREIATKAFLCTHCKGPVNDEVVRKLHLQRYSKDVFRCPNCQGIINATDLVPRDR